MIELDNLDFKIKRNGRYIELVGATQHDPDWHYQVGDFCAAKYTPWGCVEERLAARVVACLNKFKGLSLEEIERAEVSTAKGVA